MRTRLSSPQLYTLAVAIAWIGGCIRNTPDTGADHHDAPGVHTENASEHDAHAREPLVRLSIKEREEFGLKVAPIGRGELALTLRLPGEVVYDPGRLAHIVPRVPGIVGEVRKTVGDGVQAHEALAILDSKELAAIKADYLASVETRSLAEATFEREQRLRERKISSEREYLAAKTALAEAGIRLRSAGHALHALGFSPEYLRELRPDSENLSRYEIRAPFAGTIVQKHITLGEKVDDAQAVFTVADLGTVWAQLTVYQKDLDRVHAAQAVSIREDQGHHSAEARIDYVSPIVNEATRTATARVILSSPEGRWKPGQFVTGQVRLSTVDIPLAVPRAAVLTLEERPVVFAETSEGFEPRPVRLGRSDGRVFEVLGGLRPGQQIVVENAFTLKAELGKGSMEAGHSH